MGEAGRKYSVLEGRERTRRKQGGVESMVELSLADPELPKFGHPELHRGSLELPPEPSSPIAGLLPLLWKRVESPFLPSANGSLQHFGDAVVLMLQAS